MAGWSAFPDSGHLLSYGELPNAIELVVNRRTAGAMKLALPRAVLQRADRVVDTTASA